MKKWPLRWKLALYAAGLALIATIAGGGTTWSVMRYKEIEAFDQRLALDAQEFFRDVENFGADAAKNRRIFKEVFVPLALRNRLIQVSDARGEVLYLSPGLPGRLPSDLKKEFHTRRIAGRNFRMGEFSQNGLTLQVGADMKEVNQIGLDILHGILVAIPTVLLVVFIGARWVARRAIAPVEEMRQAAAQITAQRLDQRLPVPPTNDEIAGLIEVLERRL